MRVPGKTRRKQILTAATQLFSRQGFDGTTTREIARIAGVNEAIIFRHFTSKEELYWVVVSEQTTVRAECLHRHLLSSARTGNAVENVAEILLDKRQDDGAFIRLVLFSALRNAELSQKFVHNYLSESLDVISDYIRAGTKQGWLRNIDPVIGARAFVAMVAGQNLMQELFIGPRHLKYNPRQLGQQLADIWLNGVSRRQASSSVQLRSNGSARRAPEKGGNGNKAARKAGSASERPRNHAVTA
ncbi:MAG TPA: TetR/AcrR family transcriptional regulator [Terriglobales bacterium]|nr:TetR/AcrR family transcriptional regulator [Terriglobales bacterium]